MNVWQAVFLGWIQGLTEFLPISSSGHLSLCYTLFDLPQNLFFSLLLHVGSLFAVCFAYRKTLWYLLCHPKDLRVRYLLLATLPTVAFAAVFRFLLPDLVDGLLLPLGFALTAVLLILGEKFSRPVLPILKAKPWIPLVCGVAQGFAVLPGLSRSGSTVSALTLCGITREDAAEFSFLLSIPVILGSAAVESVSVLRSSSVLSWGIVGVGVVCAAIGGYLGILLLQKLLKKAKLRYFAYYLLFPFLLSLILL
mgnify:CR=1 FL=1